LAALGERCNAPLVAAAAPALFGVDDPSQVSTRIEDDKGGLPDEWAALRSDETSRWLCVATNRVVLAVDGTGAARRVVFGSPVFAAAAMVAGSFRSTGTFAKILGAPGALKAPAVQEITTGKDAGTAIPTEAFLSIRAQARLSSLGFVGLGSGRNSDTV